MAKCAVIWLSVLILGSALGQPLPSPEPAPQLLSPCPCSSPQTSDPSAPNEIIQIGPSNGQTPVVYKYGQAPEGSIVIKPGQVSFPNSPPIIVRPGQIRLPQPPRIWVKPARVQPPTPAPITVRPPPVQPSTPPPFYVRVPPVQPPQPEQIVVRPPPVPVPRPPSIKVQPPRVQPPVPEPLIVRPPRILVPAPPTICFRPNPPSYFRTIGSATVCRQTGLNPHFGGGLLPQPPYSSPYPESEPENPGQPEPCQSCQPQPISP